MRSQVKTYSNDCPSHMSGGVDNPSHARARRDAGQLRLPHITLSLPSGEQKRRNAARVKYWEIIACNLKKRGWSLGYVSAIDSEGRTI
jgi:hypothetical protein